MSRKRPRILMMVENESLAVDRRLQNQASALVAAGFGVSVISRRDPGNAKVDGVRLYEYPAPVNAATKLGFVREYLHSLLMTWVLSVKSYFADGFDAIQTCCPPDIYFTIGVPFRLLGKPLVMDQRDLSPELYEARYGRRGVLTYRILTWLERTSYRTADHTITVNDSLRDVACLRGRLPRESVTVVGNGPSLERTRKRLPRPELKQGKPYLCCFMGVMGPQDRVDYALRAVHHLVNDRGRTNCQFAFIGDGEALAASEQLAFDLGLQQHVTFTGWLEEDRAFGYLATADLGMEPNLEEIVSPVKGMDYMAFQLPFVAFDLKETRALADGAAAYARPGDVIHFALVIDELLDDPGRRAEMGRAGRRRFEEAIAWDLQKEVYLDVFRKLLALPGPGEPRTRSVAGPGRDRR